MKYLFLVRHAKSSWDNPLLDDFSRPLNERGKRDAPRMAKRLKEKDVLITHMLSSTAKRTMATAKRFAEILNFPENQIQKRAELYHATSDKMLDVLQQVPNLYPTVMLVGHNPGLTELANRLSDWRMENIPTTGIVAFKFKIDDWKQLDWKKGELLFYDYPKSKND